MMEKENEDIISFINILLLATSNENIWYWGEVIALLPNVE